MRRRTGLLLLPVLFLVSCGQDGEPADQAGGTPTSQASASQSAAPGTLPKVVGAVGSKPTIDAPDTPPAKELVVETLQEGDGEAIAMGDLMVADYLGQTWKEDKVFDNSYDRGQPIALPIGSGQVIKGLDEGLVGAKVGSRVLLSIPPDKGYGPQGNPQAGIKGDDTLVFLLDVIGRHAADAAATGEPADTPAAGLPQVSGDSAGAPEVTVPKGRKPPKKLSVTTLLRGDGAPVEQGQLLVAQYTGLTWDDGKTFDSSWERGAPAAFPIGVGQVIPGWDEALVGVPAGSRVLLVIPPDKGYGPQGNPEGGIEKNATLVFVVDVLASYGATA